MATLVQSAPVSELQFRQQHFPRQQNQSTQLSYTAAVPVEQTETSGPGNVQPTLYKQINVIPGLDADNAVVDTGIKLVRPTGGQVQVSSNTAAANANDFDGKRMRRSIQRRTVDYNASALQMLKHRLYKKSLSQKPIVHPDPLYYIDIVQPRSVLYNPINSVTSRFVRASTNKIRCPVFTVAWTPEGRRVVTGTSSGEFTLWNGLTFNFETILQAHDSAVRAMEWSHNDMWLLSGDHNGVIKYWQSNMNNVKMMQAHTDPIRGLSFCPTDNKFVTCSDDGLLKVWDFYRCQEERVLRGHGADVKCCGWHPSKSLIVSGSKDSQQPLKLWDPRSGTSLATIHGHKSTVMDLQWNKNGNWILTGSRDRLLKVFDIRAMKDVYTFRGHKKEAASVNWHPLYENMFASGGSDGSIMFWLMGCEKELGVMDCAHDGMIWDLKWHPLGHILCSGSNDHTTKFWTRNRPADKMRDKYNLNILPSGFEDDYEYELPDSSQSNGMLCESVVSSVTCDNPEKGKSGDEKTDITKSNLNTPAVKALLEQASLEVFKPDSSDPPAQIYTLSQLRPTAPAFKIDSSKQKEAIDEVERLEKRRERQLRKGADKASLDSDDDATCNAPSLLDLDIAPPAFLKEQEMKEQSMQFSNGINQGALLPNIPPHMREKASPRREAPPPRQPYMEEENRNFEGPMRSSHVMRADGPPNFERNPGHPEFNRPPPDAPHFDRPSTSGPPIFDRPPSNGPPNFTRPAHNPPPSSANRFNGKRSGDDYMDESRPNEHFNSRPGSGDFGARSRLDGEFNDGPPPRSAPIFDNRPPADSNGPMPVEDFPNRRRPGGEMLDVPPRSAGDKRPRLDGDFNRSMQRLGGEFNLRPLPEDDFKRNGNFDKRPQSKETFVHRPGVESGRFDRDMHRVPSDGMDGPHVRFNKNEPPSRLHEEPRPHQFNGPVRFDGPCIDNRGPPSAPPLRNAPFDGPPNPHPRDGLIPEKRWLDQRVSGRWQDERVRSRRPNDMDNIDEPGPNWENMERDDRERIR